ncbi:patatin-like phospholipase family protein [Brachyspira alvinipulli]|uniref:patatin-like phospholipase family protein n=1 Tax=Brachyspira alvinipulli TaxID=84379 RepID=UPI0004856C00|nr:patatin-like phospholipase family protein [Brachyspira alvinipulli]
MALNDKKIGIALSGGGIRAAIFHLGVFKWLAEENALENIEHISTVSGASIGIALLYSLNNNKFPSSKEYNKVLEKVKETIIKNDIQKKLIYITLSKQIHNFFNKPKILSDIMKKYWKITGKFSDLETIPRWSVNATTIETGKRFAFSQKHIGDYKLGYIKDLNYDISMAVAVSAAFPFFIGNQYFKIESKEWVDHNDNPITNIPKSIHLWDGGVYDNLGLEAIYKMDKGGYCKDDLDFLIVANAALPFNFNYKMKRFDIKRILDISMSQVGILRERSYIDFIKRNKNGMYIKIGNHASKILKNSKMDKDEKEKIIKSCDTKENCIKIQNYKTTLFSPTKKYFDMILRHGYETAKCCYLGYFI